MSEFVVHGIPGSPYMRSVMLGLEEKGVPYQVRALNPGDQRAEAYRKLHPFGRIPAISHGEFELYETQAILRYVDAAFPGPRLQPAQPEAIGRMNQIVGICDWYLFPHVTAVIAFQRIVGPVLMGLTPDEAAIAAAMPNARTCVGELERLLGDQEFLAGEELSVADLMAAPQLAYLALTPEGRQLFGGSRLAGWLERMQSRPSMQATLPPAPLRIAA